jgi:uncharacterized protein
MAGRRIQPRSSSIGEDDSTQAARGGMPDMARGAIGLVGASKELRPCRAVPVRVHSARRGEDGGAAADGEFIRPGRAESMRLLASTQVGRLIFTVAALPAVPLMNFAVADGLIVLRTAADTTVAPKVHDPIVAFEADDLDAATSSVWSVVVTGHATRVTDPELTARYQAVPLVPWAPAERDQFVTITTEVVEGRRVSRAAGSTDPGHGPDDAARRLRRG